MPDIMVLLACLSQCLDPTTLGQLRRVAEAMLAMTGRVTMRGLSRWSGHGGSYRTIQRFFHTHMSWDRLQWVLIRHHLLDHDDTVVKILYSIWTGQSIAFILPLPTFFPKGGSRRYWSHAVLGMTALMPSTGSCRVFPSNIAVTQSRRYIAAPPTRHDPAMRSFSF